MAANSKLLPYTPVGMRDVCLTTAIVSVCDVIGPSNHVVEPLAISSAPYFLWSALSKRQCNCCTVHKHTLKCVILEGLQSLRFKMGRQQMVNNMMTFPFKFGLFKEF